MFRIRRPFFWPEKKGSVPKDVRLLSILCLIVAGWSLFCGVLGVWSPLSRQDPELRSIYCFGLIDTDRVFWFATASIVYGICYCSVSVLLVRLSPVAWWLGLVLALDWLLRGRGYASIGDREFRTVFITGGAFFLAVLFRNLYLFRPFRPIRSVLNRLIKCATGTKNE